MFSSEQNYIYADCSWFASKTKEGLIGLGKSEKKRNRPLLKTCFKRQRLGGLAFLLANLYLPSWKHLNRRFELSASASASASASLSASASASLSASASASLSLRLRT